MKTYVINAESVVTVHTGEDLAMSADRQTFATLGEFEAAVKQRALAELVALWNSRRHATSRRAEAGRQVH